MANQELKIKISIDGKIGEIIHSLHIRQRITKKMIAIGRLQAATIIVDPLWGVAYCSAVFLGLKNNWYTAHPNNERNKIEPKTPKLGIKIMGVV